MHSNSWTWNMLVRIPMFCLMPTTYVKKDHSASIKSGVCWFRHCCPVNTRFSQCCSVCRNTGSYSWCLLPIYSDLRGSLSLATYCRNAYGSDPSIPSNMYAGRQQRSSKGILHVLKNNKISSPDCIMQRILWIMSDLVNFGDIQLITSNSMYRIWCRG